MYFNGYFQVPLSQLRQYLVERGGSFSHYYDNTVTHVLTDSLSDAKRREFLYFP